MTAHIQRSKQEKWNLIYIDGKTIKKSKDQAAIKVRIVTEAEGVM